MTEQTVTIVHILADERTGDTNDRMYIHGAVIADPCNDANVTWDYDAEPAAPVYVVEVEPAEDAAPYLAALDALGIDVTDTSGDGVWIGVQHRAL